MSWMLAILINIWNPYFMRFKFYDIISLVYTIQDKFIISWKENSHTISSFYQAICPLLSLFHWIHRFIIKKLYQLSKNLRLEFQQLNNIIVVTHSDTPMQYINSVWFNLKFIHFEAFQYDVIDFWMFMAIDESFKKRVENKC